MRLGNFRAFRICNLLMFLIVAVIRVDDIEKFANLMLQMCSLGFGVVETVVWNYLLVCARGIRVSRFAINSGPTSE